MQIVNGSGQAILASKSAIGYGYDTFARALKSYPQPEQPDENTLLFVSEAIGGYSLWQEDISDLNRLRRETRESIDKLKAANALLAEEEKVKRVVEEEKARVQLMEQLEAEIIGHAIKLSAMIEQLESANDKPKEAARVTLLLCYIKRRCNLFFLTMETETLPAGGLGIYLDELVEIALYSNVKAILAGKLEEDIPIRAATLLYDFFFNALFLAAGLPKVSISASLEVEKGSLVMRLLPFYDVSAFKIEKSLEEAIAKAGGVYEVRDVDGAAGLVLYFPKGGGGND